MSSVMIVYIFYSSKCFDCYQIYSETSAIVKKLERLDFWMSPIDKDENGYLYWRSTGEKVKYTNFANDVSNKFGPHPCLKIDWKTLLWYDRDCLTAGLFLCEKGNTRKYDTIL